MKPSPKSAVTHSFVRSHHVQVSESFQEVNFTSIVWFLSSKVSCFRLFDL